MLESLYQTLYRIRFTEEEIARIYPSDKIKSPIHLSIGQEAVSAGVCAALRPEDVVFGSYRSHALYLAKGGNLKKMLAELYGKKTGCAGGRGGSMHLIDRSAGVMGTSAIVATQIPQAVGHAYAVKLLGAGILTAVFFGDGAADEGAFSESLNFAALKKLPVLFICENNSLAVHSPQKDRQASPDLCARAKAFGVQAESLNGCDTVKVFEAAQKTVRHIKETQAPFFLEFSVFRAKEHVGPQTDLQAPYRNPEENQKWPEQDPVFLLRSRIPGKNAETIEQTVKKEVEEAFRFAEESDFPEPASLYF